jgi:hypothetical protein
MGAEIKPKGGSVVGDFLRYVIDNKKLWIVPLAILSLILGAAVLMSQSGALAPFMYQR